VQQIRWALVADHNANILQCLVGPHGENDIAGVEYGLFGGGFHFRNAEMFDTRHDHAVTPRHFSNRKTVQIGIVNHEREAFQPLWFPWLSSLRLGVVGKSKSQKQNNTDDSQYRTRIGGSVGE